MTRSQMTALLVSALTGVPALGQSLPKIPMGINVSSCNYWNPPEFIDLTKAMAEWHLKNADWSGGSSSGCPLDSLVTDPNGYPLQVPQNVTGWPPQMCEATLGMSAPAGRYVVLWDGSGSVHINLATIVSQGTNRIVISHNAGEKIALCIERSTLGNHVRNVRVIPESMESHDYVTNPFLPGFVETCSKLHCLRFMGWQGTNGSKQKSWSQRRLPGAYTQLSTEGGPGVAIEYMIQLCNQTRADMWFCVPHQADDDYMDQAAAFIKARLDPSLKLYLEYSNEVWNFGGAYTQSRWIQGIGQDTCAGAADSIRNAVKAILRSPTGHRGQAYAWLAARAFSHFLSVFSGSDRSRLVRVFATQGGNPGLGDISMAYLSSRGGCDALAVAPYFSLSDNAITTFCGLGSQATAQMMVDSLGVDVEAQRPQGGMLYDNGALAAKYATPLIFYEAGPDFRYNDCLFTGVVGQTADQANRIQAMYDVYVKHIRYSAEPNVNCQLYVPLVLYGQPAHYGHLDSANQVFLPFGQQPPKWRALMGCNAAKTVGVRGPATPEAAARPVAGPRITTRALLGGGATAGPRSVGTGTRLYDLRGRRCGAAGTAMAGAPAHAVYVVVADRRSPVQGSE